MFFFYSPQGFFLKRKWTQGRRGFACLPNGASRQQKRDGRELHNLVCIPELHDRQIRTRRGMLYVRHRSTVTPLFKRYSKSAVTILRTAPQQPLILTVKCTTTVMRCRLSGLLMYLVKTGLLILSAVKHVVD